jgi:hypothetical protein
VPLCQGRNQLEGRTPTRVEAETLNRSAGWEYVRLVK